MRTLASASFCCLVAGPALGAGLDVAIEIPRLTVAEYHRPYVAVWIEGADHEVAANLAVWYDTRLKNNEGTKWLKDMRQWWRRIGREVDMPVDGVSGPTRAPGQHLVEWHDDAPPAGNLAPGSYSLVVEAAREVGGREIVRIPFQWPPAAPETLEQQGEAELGGITLTLKP